MAAALPDAHMGLHATIVNAGFDEPTTLAARSRYDNSAGSRLVENAPRNQEANDRLACIMFAICPQTLPRILPATEASIGKLAGLALLGLAVRGSRVLFPQPDLHNTNSSAIEGNRWPKA